MNLRTVSGVAATRFSPSARSFKIAIFKGLFGDQDKDYQGRDRDYGYRHLEQSDEAAISPLGSFHVVRSHKFIFLLEFPELCVLYRARTAISSDHELSQQP